MDFTIEFSHISNRACNVYNRVSDWLAGSYGKDIFLPYYAEMSSVNAALCLRSAAESDRRISLTNQVVSGIRAIKARAWEDEFREKIKHTRK